MNKLVPFGVALATLSFAAFGGDVFYWTGAESSMWTNAANWTVGGAMATRCPGVVTTGDDAVDFPALRADEDTARFDGAFTRTVIDLDGLFSIKYVEIGGAATPSVTFGADENQRLNGAIKGKFTVEAGVLNMPVFAVGLATGFGVYDTNPLQMTYTVRNDGMGALDIGSWGDGGKDRHQATSWFASNVDFYGSGAIRVGALFANCVSMNCIRFYNTGSFYFDGDVNSACGPREITIQNCPHIEIAEGKTVNMTFNGGSVAVQSNLQTELAGPGTFAFGNGKTRSNNTKNWNLNAGAILKVSCVLKSYGSNGNADFGFLGATSPQGGYTGTLVLLNEGNDIKGPVVFNQPISIRTAKIGAAAEESAPIGSGPSIEISGNGKLVYTGAGESTTRPLILGKALSSLYGSLVQAGTGTWDVDVSPTVTEDCPGTLVLANETDAEANLNGVISDGTGATVSLKKSGAGNWNLTAVSTYTGATTVDGGTLTLKAGASISASSSLAFANGGELVVEGVDALSLPAVSAVSGRNVIRVTGDADITIAGGSGTAGTVDIRPQGAGSVTFSGLGGTKPSWLLYKGLPAALDEDGKAMVDPDYGTEIGARGSVVPDAGASANVLILKEGTEGADTLENPVTTIGGLGQFFTVPATIAIGADETLVVDRLSVDSEAASLTVGDEAGRGQVSAAELLLQNNSPTSELRVQADIKGGTRVLAANAAGTSTLAGGAVEAVDIRVRSANLRLSGENPFAIDHLDVGEKGPTTRATLVIDGAHIVKATSNAWHIGYSDTTGPSVQELGYGTVIVTNSVISDINPARTSFGAANAGAYDEWGILIGCRSVGRMEVLSGSFITNRICVGHPFGLTDTTAPQGMLVQRGGEVHALSGTSAYSGSFVGNRGTSGALVLQGGLFMAHGAFGVGLYAPATFHQHGGELVVTNLMGSASAGSFGVSAANGGIGQYVIDGGSARVHGQVTLSSGSGGSTSYADLVVTDGSFLDAKGNWVVCNSAANGAKDRKANVIVRDGGRLRLGAFRVDGDNTNSTTIVNLDGGTLLAGLADKDITGGGYEGDPYKHPNSFLLHAGGGTVDTDGKTGVRVNMPISAATGGGVVGVDNFIPFACELCPAVKVTGTGGRGASAYAVYDPDTRMVTGIKIASAGTGYTAATFTVYLRATADSKTYNAVIAQNPGTGSFTKAGEGDLTLKQPCTYTGTTILKGGTLKAGCEAAIPSASTVALAGGAFDANGFVAPMKWSFDAETGASTALLNGENAFQFPEGATIAITGIDEGSAPARFELATFPNGMTGPKPTLTGVNPAKWHLIMTGHKLKLTPNVGMLMLVR